MPLLNSHDLAQTPMSNTPSEPDLGFVHPLRYPKHAQSAKGQVYGGECNTTACVNRRAVFYNRATFGLYCPTCARRQTNQHNPVAFTVAVDNKPDGPEMDRMYLEMHAEVRRNRESKSTQSA